MLKEKKKLWLYLAAIAVLVLAAVVLLIVHAGKKEPVAPPAVTPRPTQQVVVRERPVEKLIEVEKEVTVEELGAGLNDMGVLLTQEYYFTDVVTYSSVKTLFNLELGITESGYVATYDGVVTAGVDFGAISVRKNDDMGMIVVTVPAAKILSIDIDPESFQLRSEKAGLGNPISAEDFNSSLIALERSAREKALERGLLEKAQENARIIIRNFIGGLVDPNRYVIRFEAA